MPQCHSKHFDPRRLHPPSKLKKILNFKIDFGPTEKDKVIEWEKNNREKQQMPLIECLKKFRKKRQNERMTNLQGSSRLPTEIQGKNEINSFNRFLDTQQGIEQRLKDKQEHPDLFIGSDESDSEEAEPETNEPEVTENVIEEDPKQKITKKERKELAKIKGKKDKIEELDLENF